MINYERSDYISDQENIHLDRLSGHFHQDVHTHDFAELIFISAGSCRQIIDGISYEAEAGDLFFVNFGQTHAFSCETGDLQYYNLLYMPRFFSEELINSENIYEIFRISLFREFHADTSEQTQRVSFRGEEYLQVKNLIEEMHREYTEKQTGYRSMLNGYSRVLFSRILRRLQNTQAEDTHSMQRITAQCLAYIDEHCFERITPREIAEHTFYHPAYLSRVFKACCGRSLSEYIREVRMQEAARLLAESDLPMSRILERVGYTDRKLFYRHFKNQYQLTPTQYRQTHKK